MSLQNETILYAERRKPDWRWYHGVVFYFVAQCLTIGLSSLVSSLKGHTARHARERFGDVHYFHVLKQAKTTPPSWAFGPAWTINNVRAIWGLLRVLNKPRETDGREDYLALQAGFWFIYVVFSAGYFALRSPINAFILTLSMFVLTVLSGFVALFHLRDSRVALSLATLFVWLLIALCSAFFQVAWNEDDCYHVGPFARPIPG